MTTRLARWSRLAHDLLVATIALQVFVATAGASTPLMQRCISAVVATTLVLATYRSQRRTATFARLSQFAQAVYRLRAVVIAGILLGALSWTVPAIGLMPDRVGVFIAAIALSGTIWGVATRALLGGRPLHRTLVVGDGTLVGQFMAEYRRDPHPAYELVGMITEDSPTTGNADVSGDTTLAEIVAMMNDVSRTESGIPVLGDLDALETVLAAEAVDTVVVAVRRNRLELFSRLSAWHGKLQVMELPDFAERSLGRVPVDHVNAAWFMHLIHPHYTPYSRFAKRAVDIVSALAIGCAVIPLIPLTALAVRLSSPGPVLFRQRRVGENGAEFSILKFRTMVANAEQAGAAWAAERDPRVTRVGVFLRATRIDEIPQLWNILRGQMSFVGPRPERPEFVVDLEREIPYYQRRHMVKPGLTGWAQVRMGYTDSVAGAQDKLGYELYYLRHQSLFLDFVVFLETIRVVLQRAGAR